MSKTTKSNNLSPSEIYAEQFQNSEPKFYTRIPNIIDHLTYTVVEKGKKKTKRLSIYAKELYRIIRMIASDEGTCWNSTETLAKKIGCSVGSIVKAKKELLMPIDQLDGNTLVIEKRKSINKTGPNGKSFCTVLCTRTIVDIWRWNNAFMATLSHQKQYGDTDSCSESVPSTHSYGESVPPGTDSCGECNNNPCSKIPLSKEQQPTADAAPACSFKDRKRKLLLSEEQAKSYDWMVKNGCNEKAAHDIAKKFTSKEISFASEYLLKQQKYNKSKNKKIQNIWGYFRQTLNGRYWEK